jgi:hypothetical protein
VCDWIEIADVKSEGDLAAKQNLASRIDAEIKRSLRLILLGNADGDQLLTEGSPNQPICRAMQPNKQHRRIHANFTVCQAGYDHGISYGCGHVRVAIGASE